MANRSVARRRHAERRLLLIARQLEEAGYAVSLSSTRIGLTLVATLSRSDHCHAFARLTGDGTVELRLRAGQHTVPGQAAAAIISAAAQFAAVISPSADIQFGPYPPFGPGTPYDVPATQCAGVAHVTGAPDRLVEQDRSIDDSRQDDASGVREHLRERLEKLPPGHPSSPYEADGSVKPPPPNLSEQERPFPTEEVEVGVRVSDSRDQLAVEPLTDVEYADHIQSVRERLSQAHADGLATDEQYTVDSRHEVWAKDRRILHDGLIDHLYQEASDVPCEGKAVVAGGLPGAGKTTVLEKYAGIDRSKYLTINPDDIKEELARRGLIPDVEGLSPMEASDLAHEESSHIAKRLARRAQSEQKNIIWDITMSSLDSAQFRLDSLRDGGYSSIQGVFIDLPPTKSVERAESRHRNDHEKYRTGEGHGGRYLREEYIMANADSQLGSINRRTFESLKPGFDEWSIYDNSVDGRPPVLMDTGAKEKHDGERDR